MMTAEGMSIAGLRNLGNTCYFNAVLQALASSKRFRQYLAAICPLETLEDDERRLNFTSELHANLEALAPRERYLIAGAVEPRGLNEQLGKCILGFRGGRQQDAEEWFQLIMELCEEEYKKSQPMASLFDLIRDTNSDDDSKSTNPFYGLGGTLLECTICHMRKPMWTDRFLDLKLSLSPTMDARNVFQHLQDSWRHYTSQEQIEGVECTNCTLVKLIHVVKDQLAEYKVGDPMEFVDVPSLWEGGDSRNILRCDVVEWRQNLIDILTKRLITANKVCDLDMDGSGWSEEEQKWFSQNEIDDPRDCRRTYTTFLRYVRLMRCPDVLTFHINRNVFLHDAMVKLDTYLQFELTLSVEDLLLDHDSSGEDHVYDSLIYDAIAVIVHHGNEKGGHYTCYRRLSPGNWVHVSDDRVMHVPTSEVIRAKAYMLFYERR
ncbi:ubiquitin-specific protease [Thraustotheca clavata]|uniref:Ubiquitin-specific protease n=1 Tax=Thraustotheca clavata TaxID=74557 RepID=A0A1V9ZWT2_9STRA|nr:ubiquitin-specific protease [Thraustotheca clavata]